jgi:cytidine deaminase
MALPPGLYARYIQTVMMMTARIATRIPVEWCELYQAALQARLKAYAPYSEFQVGAAIRSKTGTIFAGCNIENASSGLTVCAERVAIWEAIAAGEREFQGLVVITSDGSTPCGACRQVMYEFASDLALLVADLEGNGYLTNLALLLPDAFTLRSR